MSTVLELRNNNKVLNHLKMIKAKSAQNEYRDRQRIGMVELHLTDKCDLNCIYCSYGTNIKHKNQIYHDFPFQSLERIAEASPKAVVIAGGGEPTMYQDGDKDIDDVISFFKEQEISVGVITNGCKLVDCDLFGDDDWIRVSLDADTQGTFNQLKNGNFEKRLKTIVFYAGSRCRNVGIGFLYNRFSLEKIPRFIKSMYDMIMNELGENSLYKINLQFRPTCPIESCECPSGNYEGKLLLTPDQYSWWGEAVDNVRTEAEELFRDSGFSDFVHHQTNFYQIFEERKSAYDFKHCYMSLAKWLIKTNGDIYSCVMKATNDSKKLGNIITDHFDAIYENELKYFELEKNYCSGVEECCRITGVINQIVQDNYEVISDDIEYGDSYFF